MKMQTFRKPHQWLSFWLEKYAEVLAELKYGGEQRKAYWQILKLFLETLPGNPRNIPLESIRSFINDDPAKRLVPIQLFYQHIASSKPHLEMLSTLDATGAGSPIGSETDPLEQFRAALVEQEFGERTIKNYCSSVAAYLRWLTDAPGHSSGATVEAYSTYLATEKKLAPRTVALHLAALKLYHQRIPSGGSPESKA
jgi:hypothetical protein